MSYLIDLLNTVGIKTFVEYFSIFEKNKTSRSNQLIFDEFAKNNENWNKNSLAAKATTGKRIFKEGFEVDALRHIINSANEQRVGAEVIEKAQKIYASKQPSLDSSIINQTQDNLIIEQILMGEDLKVIEKMNPISQEEKQALVKIRLGQSYYRNELITLWGGCAVTGCTNTNVLLASHIKAYKLCAEQEKYDKFNGLLLSPTYDKLFDLYLISFDEDGGILISEDITDNDLKALNISRNDRLRQTFPENQKYLQHHRDIFFNLKNKPS